MYDLSPQCFQPCQCQHFFSKNSNRLVHFVLPAFLSRLICRRSLPVLPSCSQEKRARDNRHASSHYTNMQIQMEMCRLQCLTAVCMCLPVQIENIDACLSFLAAKGVNIQGLSSEGKLDSYTSAFTGAREVNANQGQDRPIY